jgi:hypothetical protein
MRVDRATPNQPLVIRKMVPKAFPNRYKHLLSSGGDLRPNPVAG